MAAKNAFGLLFFCVIKLSLCGDQNSKTVSLCSYFGGGRSPKEAYSLSNCTWYNESACCERTEVTSVFSEMPPLLTDNRGCYHRINYLMCYFCSPDQHLWFHNTSASVCRSYCDDIYRYCASAQHDGHSIASKYKNGVEFCEAQMFNVIDKDGENCFDFDSSHFDAAPKGKARTWLLVTIVLTGYSFRLLISGG